MGLMRLLPRPNVRAHTTTEEKSLQRVIVFANQKGGVAKTTTTLNLAVAFKEQGFRVLVVDLDPQGNLTMSQGMNPDAIERSMFDVLVHRLPISEIIHSAEVDVAVASIDLAGAELALSSMIGRERALEKALVEVRDAYDFIMVDTPPSLGLLTINACVAATSVIVPVQCEYLSLRGLVQLENTLAMVRENLNPDVKIEGILPTMFDRRTLHSREAVEILEESFGDLLASARDSDRHSEIAFDLLVLADENVQDHPVDRIVRPVIGDDANLGLLLAETIHAAFTLLVPRGVPRQVVVKDGAEVLLKVNAFRQTVGADQYVLA